VHARLRDKAVGTWWRFGISSRLRGVTCGDPAAGKIVRPTGHESLDRRGSLRGNTFEVASERTRHQFLDRRAAIRHSLAGSRPHRGRSASCLQAFDRLQLRPVVAAVARPPPQRGGVRGFADGRVSRRPGQRARLLMNWRRGQRPPPAGPTDGLAKTPIRPTTYGKSPPDQRLAFMQFLAATCWASCTKASSLSLAWCGQPLWLWRP